MWRRRKEARLPNLANDLVAECEAFLSGAYLRYLVDRCREIPAWVWINDLAHGDEAEVRRAAARSNDRSDPHSLIVDIAREILMAIDEGIITLKALQRRTLHSPRTRSGRKMRARGSDDSAALTRELKAVIASGLQPLPWHGADPGS